MSKVFVYGSLLSGLGNHEVMQRAEGYYLGKGKLRGFTMHDLGAFPAIRPVPGLSPIIGELYEVDDEGLRRLDRLEGHPTFYRRYQRTIVTDAGTARAWVYVLANPTDRPMVRSGDWRAHEEAMADLADAGPYGVIS